MKTRTVVALIASEFVRYQGLGEGALIQLDAEQLGRGTPDAQSVATLVWHVAGNLESRFTDFLESDGEKPWRDRESEFASRTPTRDALRAKWERGFGVLMDALDALTDADLARTVTIRKLPLRVDEALFRSLAHTSYHVGQIVYRARALRGDAWEYLSIPPGEPDRPPGPAPDPLPSR